MDPNAALDRIREIIKEIYAADDAGDDCHDAAIELAEKFEGLDQWIGRGGFLPTSWAVKGVAT